MKPTTCFGATCYKGDYATAELHANAGIAKYKPVEHHPLTYKYSGHDPGVCCLAFSALLLWIRGFPDQSLGRANEAYALANKEMHPLSIAVAEWGLSFVHLLRRDAGEGRHWAEKEIEISQKYVLPLMLSTGKVQLGWALAEQGHVGEAIEHMLRGAAAMRATGAQMGLPFFLGILAQAHLDNNDCRQGLEVVDEAIVTATESHALFQFPELLRIKGKI